MCNTPNALNVLVVRKQTSLEQTSETISAKRRIAEYRTLDSHAAVWGVGGGVSTRHGRRRRRADEVASAAAAAT